MLMYLCLGLLILLWLAPIVAGWVLFFAWRVKHGWRRVVAWIGLAFTPLWLVYALRWWEEASHTPP